MKNSDGSVNDKRTVKLENVMDKKYIPFLTGRPVRESPIDNDDIINLKIALHVSSNVDELLSRV
ncbi:MAG: hypothetical protein A2487_03705 [Candidatus Raymondbacteria bacterium RifOxyC12_full_50_8]|uniref:Uncharacterized protein n=1 Tax=Candidatus Raymondbacteria bacterium RIFOXYD12_FULL_49_13 TaxID=1817890 RepID=A0A1F7FJZ4_UNCRA|nr:MAG: hypothetical protein A2350_10510 [Candidatus Raymondbacteria bacterium RifOxyB12_full_50_8]OGJ91968.1 MAG: hypothetical protein A2248_09340 [Candidatus Raymondbacteria bacterium RIFOXYA2_FULL_49_16]OGJ96365.1 MAG: hypothetical protein A2453_08555 [Candidatus Raymondbacteria bacterium RIFOXYC2_FULL_50_21]OGK03179.1 MAG: hypothetical protein A2487_03705 [Candidatus Raymondbacteria bacterium RifOxyC12_full_50_8]OGK06901.1 MAG: hypothetical protein A2519_11620 [Candidatus Raymondbacteria ba